MPAVALHVNLLKFVLGIDNIIFISLIANKLPKKLQAKATNLRGAFGMVQRIIAIRCFVLNRVLKIRFSI